MSMTQRELERDIGTLCAEVKNQRALLNEVRSELKAVRSQLDQMKGGKAALFGLLAVAGGIGALVTQGLHWFRG